MNFHSENCQRGQKINVKPDLNIKRPYYLPPKRKASKELFLSGQKIVRKTCSQTTVSLLCSLKLGIRWSFGTNIWGFTACERQWGPEKALLSFQRGVLKCPSSTKQQCDLKVRMVFPGVMPADERAARFHVLKPGQPGPGCYGRRKSSWNCPESYYSRLQRSILWRNHYYVFGMLGDCLES